ncbi:MAG: glycosyltransferase family 2 protein [Fimbriimonadaceae bacterium]|nr:glycosyltransferase family 2 protein [Fimbriimonadaceae bacterium]
MLSVLVVNWNTKSVLGECLQSLKKYGPGSPFEVLVLDNASSDGSAEMVRRDHPWVQLVESVRNVGYAAGNNALFERAKGDLLLTLNPDTSFEDDTLDRSVHKMEERPDVAVLAPRLVGLDGNTQRSVRGFPSALGILGELTGLGRAFPNSVFGSYGLPAFDYEAASPAPQPMGTYLLFRRSALEAVGDARRPFDERFPIFFNEVDLLRRLADEGFACWYFPDLHVIHHGGESTRQVRKSMIWESHRSLLRYLWKHHGVWWKAPAFGLLGLVVWGAALVRARGVHAGFRP